MSPQPVRDSCLRPGGKSDKDSSPMLLSDRSNAVSEVRWAHAGVWVVSLECASVRDTACNLLASSTVVALPADGACMFLFVLVCRRVCSMCGMLMSKLADQFIQI